MKQCFKEFNFRSSTLVVIEQVNEIAEEYQADGYNLTLRQLYYQFVARDIFPDDRRWRWTGSKWVKDESGTKNAQPNYNWLGIAVNNGRLAGLIGWDVIKDRTRAIQKNSHWSDPKSIIESCADCFAIDTRLDQDTYLEVWVEKEALAGVVERACREIDIPWFACRGYVSQSAMYEAAMRCERRRHPRAVILHLGDNDPSGVDMTRDNSERMEMFGVDVTVKRIALNMDQVEEFNLPPNPAKLTDTRCSAYIEKFGDKSWELDALNPHTLVTLIQNAAAKYTDISKREALIQQQEKYRELLSLTSYRWDDVVRVLKEK